METKTKTKKTHAPRLHAAGSSIRRNWQLHLMILIPMIYVIIFFIVKHTVCL